MQQIRDALKKKKTLDAQCTSLYCDYERVAQYIFGGLCSSIRDGANQRARAHIRIIVLTICSNWHKEMRVRGPERVSNEECHKGGAYMSSAVNLWRCGICVHRRYRWIYRSLDFGIESRKYNYEKFATAIENEQIICRGESKLCVWGG